MPKPVKRPKPKKPDVELGKVGRDDGQGGQAGSGVEQEISRSPYAGKKK